MWWTFILIIWGAHLKSNKFVLRKILLRNNKHISIVILIWRLFKNRILIVLIQRKSRKCSTELVSALLDFQEWCFLGLCPCCVLSLHKVSPFLLLIMSLQCWWVFICDTNVFSRNWKKDGKNKALKTALRGPVIEKNSLWFTGHCNTKLKLRLKQTWSAGHDQTLFVLLTSTKAELKNLL